MSPTGAAAESLRLRLRTGHFRVLADRATDDVLQAIAQALEAAYPRVLADLQVENPGEVAVEVWQGEASYFAEMRRFLGRRYDAAGYVTGPDTIRVLAVPRAPLNATHEFCHAISPRVNPTFGNSPRWLWESVALFENGEFVDPRTLGYMVPGRYPTLAALDADPSASRQVYEVGYVIAEFIVARAGRAGLRALVRANGRLATVGFGRSPSRSGRA